MVMMKTFTARGLGDVCPRTLGDAATTAVAATIVPAKRRNRRETGLRVAFLEDSPSLILVDGT
jgi:hypothetical protein